MQSKVNFFSNFLGVVQLIIGALSIAYVGYVWLEAGQFSIMSLELKRFYSSLIVQYCGSGAAYMLTGACILGRQEDAVPALAFITGLWTMLFSVQMILKEPHMIFQLMPVFILISVYLIWFGFPTKARA